MYDWKDNGNNTLYYYKISTGLVGGQVHQLAHTQVWVAKVWTNPAEEKHLGIYISNQHAKSAIEFFYDMQERTLLEHGNV